LAHLVLIWLKNTPHHFTSMILSIQLDGVVTWHHLCLIIVSRILTCMKTVSKCIFLCWSLSIICQFCLFILVYCFVFVGLVLHSCFMCVLCFWPNKVV